MDTRLHRPTWQKVSALCKGQVYMEVRRLLLCEQREKSESKAINFVSSKTAESVLRGS